MAEDDAAPPDIARRKGYHHGALKAALVEAARRLIAEKGPSGFTLLEAARMAGVSAAAPYRHFKDRGALIDAVAREGFEVFSARLGAAWNEGAPDRDGAFSAMGHAYIAFAREEPGYYGAMFGRGERGRSPRDVNTASARRAFDLLVEAARPAVAGAPGLDPRLVGLHIWAVTHGVATLFEQSGDAIPLSPEQILDSAIEVYLRGLAATPAG